MLIIKNLSVAIEQQLIIHNLDLTIAPGQVHALMGLNGSGKSTLAYTLVGHPRYTVTSGSIELSGRDVLAMSVDARARAGILLAFQHPLEIPGVTVFHLLHEAYQARFGTIAGADFQQIIFYALELIGLDRSFIDRSVNVGFSGGERKRAELLQLLVLRPELVIFDEIDSGLDVDALKMITQTIEFMRMQNPQLIIVLISHYDHFLQAVEPQAVHVMHAGCIVQTGLAALAHEIAQHGYQRVIR